VTAIKALRTCSVFRGLKEEQLEKVAALCAQKVCVAGTLVFKAGENAKHLFIVVKGKVSLQMDMPVQKPKLRKSVSVDVIAEREMFGWSGLVDPNVHPFTAICLQETELFAIDAPKLFNLLQDDCAMGFEVMNELNNVVAIRLRDTAQLLVAERSLV
jgi:CRP-like cAMP-binding protein